MVDKLKFIWSQAWEFLKPFILILMNQAGQALMTAAMSAVAAAAQGDMSNADRRNLAFEKIGSDLAAQGIQIGTNAINLALEAAVAKLKNDTGT